MTKQMKKTTEVNAENPYIVKAHEHMPAWTTVLS